MLTLKEALLRKENMSWQVGRDKTSPVFRGETVTCNYSWHSSETHTLTQNILLCLGGKSVTSQPVPLCVWKILERQRQAHTPFIRGAVLPFTEEAAAAP